MNNQKTLGQLSAVLAFLIWGGLSPIYFKEIEAVEPLEILVYRVVFSVITLLPIIYFTKDIKNIISVLGNTKKMQYLFFSTFVISLNWLIFIWAVTNEKILEASLGYYINPLINVLLGYLFLGERMSKNQNIAIFIALCAVLYQFYTLKEIPLVSISLAVSFALYGFFRKKVNINSISGLFIEVLILLPFCLAYLFYINKNQGIYFVQGESSYVLFLITLAGLMTIIPLFLFNFSALRMKLSTLGFFQYIAPTVAFLLAIFLYNEEFNLNKMITFVLIWIALGFFSIDSLKKIFKTLFY